jgi:hypothetical protein
LYYCIGSFQALFLFLVRSACPGFSADVHNRHHAADYFDGLRLEFKKIRYIQDEWRHLEVKETNENNGRS